MNFACYKIHEITLRVLRFSFFALAVLRFSRFGCAGYTELEQQSYTDAEFCMLQNGVAALNPKKLD